MSDSCADVRPGKAHPLDIVHVMGSIDAAAAGPSYSVPRLCRALAELKHAVMLVSGTANREVFLSRQDGYEDHRYPLGSALPGIGKLGLSTTLRDGIFTAAARGDVLHMMDRWLQKSQVLTQWRANRVLKQGPVPWARRMAYSLIAQAHPPAVVR